MKKQAILICIFAFSLLLASCSSQPSLDELDTWDLVWISDSSGWGVAELYASMLEQDMGVSVNLHDNWIGGLSAGTVLDALEGKPTASFTLEKLPEEIMQAEVIVFYANPEESMDPDNPWDWNCVGYDAYVNACEMDMFGRYTQHLERIYELIFELRDGQPTIVRAYDAYNPRHAQWRDNGVYAECQTCWAHYNAAIHQAASTYSIPVAAVAEAWNGPNRDQDPNDKGYTKDGVHPNETGALVIAEAIRSLGYEPVVP